MLLKIVREYVVNSGFNPRECFYTDRHGYIKVFSRSDEEGICCYCGTAGFLQYGDFYYDGGYKFDL